MCITVTFATYNGTLNDILAPVAEGCLEKFVKLNIHIKKKHCKCNETQHIFLGGVFANKKTLFEEIEELDMVVPDELKRCKFLCIFDFEALLKPVCINLLDSDGNEYTESIKNMNVSNKLKYMNYHQPVSCTILSNVPNYDQSTYFEDENPDSLTHRFINYLKEISDQQYLLLIQRYRPIFEQIDEKIEKAKQYIKKLKQEEQTYKRKMGYVKLLTNLKNKLNTFCH